MIRITLCGAAALLTSGLVAAQDAGVTGTNSIAESVREMYRNLDGQEVRIEGAVGMFAGSGPFFVDETGRYDLKLDAGRDVRRRIEGCQVNPYDRANSPCQVVGMAEIETDAESDDIHDGIEIELLLYSVESLKTGAE